MVYQSWGENMKFFHAMATEWYQRNTISMLRGADDVANMDHQRIAAML
jgi:hypothetical protein